MFFFFKQKTAYEMRISDWSSDVCSSDLSRIACSTSSRVMRRCASTRLRSALACPTAALPELNSGIGTEMLNNTAVSFDSENRRTPGPTVTSGMRRSEEHTSELQSLMRISYAVFCLTKKNNTHSQHMSR